MYKYFIQKKIILILPIFFTISLNIFSMGFPGYKNNFHQEYIDEITLNSWVSNFEINTDTFLSISHTFIDMMHDWTKNDYLWINNQLPKDYKLNLLFRYSFFGAHERIEGKTFLEVDYLLNYIAKWILPNDRKVNFIGDIHGNFYTIKKILIDMQKNGFIDENMHLSNDGILIFLGDYIDRGQESLKVFTTAMLLAVKNPGKVFLLRGNHEDISAAYNNNFYGFKTEIEQIEEDGFFRTSILNNLAKAFEFLPAALLVGYAEDNKFKCQLCAHGGPEIRLDYRKFSSAMPDDKANGICLKEVLKNDFLTEEEIKKLMSDYLKIAPIDGSFEIEDFLANVIFNHKDVKAYFNHTSSIIGFLWNDISFEDNQNGFIQCSGRGDGLIVIHHDFIKYFFHKMSNLDVKFIGIIRGHEHNLPKYISKLENQLTEIPYPFCTPAVGTLFYYKDSTCYKLLQYNAANYFNSYNFTVHTLISGLIFAECSINYNPTFLEMKYLGNDNWMFKPHEICL